MSLEDASASCSLWWRHTPRHDGQRIGAIGQFQAADAESGARLLEAACRELARQGCRLAVGPMDGSTWRSYRLVIERGDAPWFFLEPATPAHFAACFAAAGFAVAATYCSSVQADLDFRENFLRAVARRAAAAGVRIRPLDPQDPQADLRAMHAIALSAFARSFLFSPITCERFVAQYSQLLPYVRPELVLIAERDGEPVAFGFGVPDALEAARGAPAATVILKTIAARPGLVNAGIAHLLVAAGARAAAGLGYTRAVHALMHESNNSLRWSAHHARVFRRYALFGRNLNLIP
jgi:predicted N-acetyltransferase YhbS